MNLERQAFKNMTFVYFPTSPSLVPPTHVCADTAYMIGNVRTVNGAHWFYPAWKFKDVGKRSRLFRTKKKLVRYQGQFLRRVAVFGNRLLEIVSFKVFFVRQLLSKFSKCCFCGAVSGGSLFIFLVVGQICVPTCGAVVVIFSFSCIWWTSCRRKKGGCQKETRWKLSGQNEWPCHGRYFCHCQCCAPLDLLENLLECNGWLRGLHSEKCSCWESQSNWSPRLSVLFQRKNLIFKKRFAACDIETLIVEYTVGPRGFLDSEGKLEMLVSRLAH